MDAFRNVIHQVTRRGVCFAGEVFKTGELTPILVWGVACVEAMFVLLMAFFMLCALHFAIKVTHLCRRLSGPET